MITKFTLILEYKKEKTKRLADDALKTNADLQKQLNAVKASLETISKEKQRLETENDNLERKERLNVCLEKGIFMRGGVSIF